MREAGVNNGCKALAEALHGACVALETIRRERGCGDNAAGPQNAWVDTVGMRVAMAIAAVPDSALRGWLMDERVVGGEEIYKTLRAGAELRATPLSKVVAA